MKGVQVLRFVVLMREHHDLYLFNSELFMHTQGVRGVEHLDI